MNLTIYSQTSHEFFRCLVHACYTHLTTPLLFIHSIEAEQNAPSFIFHLPPSKGQAGRQAASHSAPRMIMPALRNEPFLPSSPDSPTNQPTKLHTFISSDLLMPSPPRLRNHTLQFIDLSLCTTECSELITHFNVSVR